MLGIEVRQEHRLNQNLQYLGGGGCRMEATDRISIQLSLPVLNLSLCMYRSRLLDAI